MIKRKKKDKYSNETTISISNELLKYLKIISALNSKSYEEIIRFGIRGEIEKINKNIKELKE